MHGNGRPNKYNKNAYRLFLWQRACALVIVYSGDSRVRTVWTVRIGKPGEDSQDRTTGKGQSGEDSRERKVRTGQPGEDSLERTA
jgi:hypothetical protein